jgi:hypothetical protein
MRRRSVRQSVAYRVAKGIKLLNREYGKSWLRIIDPERLALENCEACVLGQLEGEYSNGTKLLGIKHNGAPYGFDRYDGEDDSAYDRLTRAWRKNIKELRRLFCVE